MVVEGAVQTGQFFNSRTSRKIYAIEINAIQFNEVVLLKEVAAILSR